MIARMTGGARRGGRRGVPLRLSLVGLTLVLVVVGLLVSGIAVTSAMRQDLISRTDVGLVESVNSWAKPRDHQDRPPLTPPGPRRPPSPYYVATQSLGASGPDVYNYFSDEPDLTGLDADQVGPITVGSAGGHGPSWRVIKRTNQFGRSVVATPLSDVDRTLSRLMWLQFGVGAIVVVALAALSYWLVRSSLRPLRRVEETAHAIAAGDLDMRVPEAAPNTEVGSLAESINTMLGQIQRAFAATEASEHQARASEAKMRRFVADAGHELRTPLTSIKGFAELYSDPEVPDAADAMRRIDEEASRMGLLVEDLLILARLDAERPVEKQPVDMLATAADAVRSVRVAAPGRQIDLEVSAGDRPPMVAGDPSRLRQVIGNLLSNAVAHTPPDATIRVSVEVGDDVRLTVRDTGPGIDPQDVGHVFERFYRGDASRRRGDGGGSGLGLSIVAALVEAHGGRVGVDSEPGAGASFWVRLPLLDA